MTSDDLLSLVKSANRVYLCGNGGSAANAIHIANDLMSAGIPAFALLDIATVTAIANDFGYDHIFSYQLGVIGRSGDLLICLTGSGNSKNILNAVATAKDMQISVVAITMGGKISKDVDCLIEGDNMQESEENQLKIGHYLMKRLKHVYD